MELLDFIPIVGTVKNTVECVAAALDGDRSKALEKGLSAIVGGTLDVVTFGAGFAICQMLAKETVTYVAVGVAIANFIIREKIVRPVSKSIPLQQPTLRSTRRRRTPARSVPVFTQTVNDQPPTSRSAPRHRTQAEFPPANARTTNDSRPTSEPTSRSTLQHCAQAESPPANARTINDSRPKSRSALRHRAQAQSAPVNEHLHSEAEESQLTDTMQSPHMSYSRLAEIIYFFQSQWQWHAKEDEPKENKQPSRRGEHVINNNVLNVYRDIVQSFVSHVLGDNLDDMIKSGRLSKDSRVIEAINQPIPGPTADFIRYQMVVYYDEEFQDKNAITYGREIEILRNTVINYMRHVHEEVVYHISAGKLVSRIPALERDVRDTVGMFIAGKYFVDYETLAKWLKQPGNDREQFEEARQTVISMFRNLIYDNGNDMVITWVNELIHAWRKK